MLTRRHFVSTAAALFSTPIANFAAAAATSTRILDQSPKVRQALPMAWLHSNWQWHLDEVFVKTNGERFYLWPAVVHEGDVLESFVTKRGDKTAAKKFLIKTMRQHGRAEIITTEKLPSYRAAFRDLGVANRQLCGGRSNNRCENSHFLFRRRERAVQRFKSAATLQRFVSYHGQIYNHLKHERHLEASEDYKRKRCAALTEWFQICAF